MQGEKQHFSCSIFLAKSLNSNPDVRNFRGLSRFLGISAKNILYTNRECLFPRNYFVLANHEYLFVFSDFYTVKGFKSHIKSGSTAKDYFILPPNLKMWSTAQVSSRKNVKILRFRHATKVSDIEVLKNNKAKPIIKI